MCLSARLLYASIPHSTDICCHIWFRNKCWWKLTKPWGVRYQFQHKFPTCWTVYRTLLPLAYSWFGLLHKSMHWIFPILQWEESNAQIPLRLAWEAGGQSIQYSRLPPQSEVFFQPLGGNSTLQIGYICSFPYAKILVILLFLPSMNNIPPLFLSPFYWIFTGYTAIIQWVQRRWMLELQLKMSMGSFLGGCFDLDVAQ